MAITIKRLPKSQVEIKGEIPFDTLTRYFSKAAKEISRNLDIPGFRKGTAPYEVVRGRVSEYAILEKAAQFAISEFYQKSVDDYKLEPVSSPSVEVTKLAPGNALTFRITVPVVPEVLLPDWQRISKEICAKKRSQEVSEKEVEEALLYLRRSRRTFHDVSRACRAGDRVQVSFQASEDGASVEGVSATNQPIILGEEKLLPGFEEAIIGLSKGEEKEFTCTVPQNWWHAAIRGKRLTFRVRIENVQEVKDAEFSDEFAKSLGSFETMEALRASIREGIMQEKEAKEKERIRGEILAEIVKRAKFEMPDVVLHNEEMRLRKEFEKNLEMMGLTFREYLSQTKKTEEEVKAELAEEAKKRVATGFILRAIAKEEGIQVSDEEIEERAQKELRRFRSVQEVEREIDPRELREYSKNVLKAEKILERIANC